MTEITIIVSITVGVFAVLTAGLRFGYEYVRNKKPNTQIKKKDVQKIIENIRKNINDTDYDKFIKNIEQIFMKINQEILGKDITEKQTEKIEYLKEFIENNLKIDEIKNNFNDLSYNVQLMGNLEILIEILEGI